MSRVRTGSRMHFGLFRLPATGDNSVRRFGGIGLMIDKPGVEVSVRPAADWSTGGPQGERALAFARTFLANSPELEQRPLALDVARCAPEHVGLGTGTQLGLAVARAVAVELGRPDWDAVELARRCGRGLRSGIGVHGFQHGGFLVDGGKKSDTDIALLIARHDFPDEWAIVLTLPKKTQGVHGEREREAFAQLTAGTTQQTDALCRLTLLGILPAMVERNLDAFGDALHEFNRKVGEMFQPWQGGIYSDERTASLVKSLRDVGIRGVGQSSWGPAVFAITRNEVPHLMGICDWLQRNNGIEPEQLLITSAANGGARVMPHVF